MKISYITMGFPVPTETFASLDIKSIFDSGNKVKVYCLRMSHKKHNTMIKARNLFGIDIFYINYLKIILSPILLLLYFFKTIDLLIWLIKSERNNITQLLKCILLIPSSIYIFREIKKDVPDIVHLFWGHYPSIPAYLIKKYLPNIPLTIFLGAYDLELNLSISKEMANRSNDVFTHSASNISLLKSMGIKESKINLIYRSVDYDLIKKTIKGINKINKKIISSGKLIKEKNFEAVIKIFSKILQHDNNYSLEIVGSGPEKSNLISLAKKLNVFDKVIFNSHINQIDLFKKMASAEYFLFLSNKKSERLPNVIKEAMACKCICICSNTLGIHELINNGVNGYIVNNINDFDYYQYFHTTTSTQNCIIKNSDFTIKKNFNIRRSKQLYLKIWEKIINYK